jgi:repressor LexA
MSELMFENDDLTPKQREVLSQLLGFVTENSYPPSIQQLCQLCGVSSTSTIHFHLSALKKKGLIDWNPAEKRAISIREDVRDAYRAAQGMSEVASSSEAEDFRKSSVKGDKTSRRTRRLQSTAGGDPIETADDTNQRGVLPMLGAIAAGSPLQTLKDTVERIDLSEDLCPPGCYALRVRGTSMIEDHIMDEDIVIINPEARVREGDVVVALVDQETATLKRFYREKDRIRLQPANSEMEPIYVTDVHIQGKVEAVIRRY